MRTGVSLTFSGRYSVRKTYIGNKSVLREHKVSTGDAYFYLISLCRVWRLRCGLYFFFSRRSGC